MAKEDTKVNRAVVFKKDLDGIRSVVPALDLDKYGLDSERYLPLMVVKYVGIWADAVGEESAFSYVADIFNLTIGSVKNIWNQRREIMLVTDADFELAGNVLKHGLQEIYLRVLSEVSSRDLSEESMSSLMRILKTVSGALKDISNPMSGMGGVVLAGENSTAVNVQGGLIIQVPMPQSAKDQTVVIDGRIVDRAVLDNEQMVDGVSVRENKALPGNPDDYEVKEKNGDDNE